MSITITIEGQDAAHARREMRALLGEPREGLNYYGTPGVIGGPELPAKDVTAGEIVDALHGALKAETAAEDADGVEFPAAATEPPKKRGRPRKPVEIDEPVTVAAYVELPDDITGQEIAEKFAGVRDGQIDIEDVIAEQKTAQEPAEEANAQETAPQPEDPSAGWTTQDARNAGRALLDRAPDVDTGNRKLAATLVPFGVQQVKALQPDQIEAFVVATQKAVF